MVGKSSSRPSLNISIKGTRPGRPCTLTISGETLHEACLQAEEDAVAAAQRLVQIAGDGDPALLCELARMCQTGPVGRVGRRDCSRRLALALLDRVRDTYPTYTRALWMRGEALLTAPHGGRSRPPQTPASLAEAEELFARAAALGDAEGVFLQGRLLVTTAPDHRSRQRAAQGLALIQRASRAGVARAYVSEALCYEKPDEYAPARFPSHSVTDILSLYVKAADLGDALALNDIGNSIATGYAGLTPSFDEAERYYQRAISGGAVVAYENIGTLYESGMDGQASERIDIRRAHEYYMLGAHLRSARCCLFMASAFDEGVPGVISPNPQYAELYYELAFWIADDEQNDGTANFALKDLCSLHVTRMKTNKRGSAEASASLRMLTRFLNVASIKAMLKDVDGAIVKARRGDDGVLQELLGDFNAKRVLAYKGMPKD